MNTTTKDPRALGFLLVDVTRLFRKQFDRRAEPLGLTRAQWRALRVIDRQPGLSQTALAEALEMEPIPVGRVVDRLQQAGFVERRADPNDRRRWCLYCSDHAGGVVAEMEVIAQSLRDDALTAIAPEQVAQLTDILARMRGADLRCGRGDGGGGYVGQASFAPGL